ncbi:MAG: 2,3,4,5-tetrahydropyridine-2,6-dicarboxylate N-succinyltransferase [Planctomycetota bacterium]|nr:2,3,4,5-tetrahydropyridine-2,6-dicarboxylate N-succinyltransferase [Planctomycetota bacterium]
MSSARPAGEELFDALESGELRVAERDADGAWRVQAWVKEAILEVFRTSPMAAHGGGFVDKAALPVRRFAADAGVRLVPGGSAVRRGAFVGAGVVIMPPAYVNVGAHVGAGAMIDSHVLVGSCAQIGARVHLSAGAQIGGVLEPIGSRPVIVEDDCLIGGLAGIYEGVLVRRGAVIGAGVTLTASTPVFDLVRERELRGQRDAPLEIPADAVVVPGTRPAKGDFARERGLDVACALIVKYRDASTDRATALEDALR